MSKKSTGPNKAASTQDAHSHGGAPTINKRGKKKMASEPCWGGVVKTFHLHIFRDDRDLALKLLVMILCGGAVFGNSLFGKMLYLSYRVPEEVEEGKAAEPWYKASYAKGLDDLYFVAFWIIAFTYIRMFVMKDFFYPLARQFGIRGSKVERFAEQGYIVLYYVLSWVSGMWLMYNSPYWMNTEHYWIGYPFDKLNGAMKTYYLMQFGYWMQQFYVLHTDMKRRDHNAMLIHHFITSLLIGGSYFFHVTPIGNAILAIMDVADVFLAVPKMLRYMGFRLVCDVLFGLFVVAWAYTRHYLFVIVIHALIYQAPQLMDMSWNPAENKLFTPFVKNCFVTLLVGLELVLCFWFLMILKVIFKMFNGASADDNRSHDEESELEEADRRASTEKTHVKPTPVRDSPTVVLRAKASTKA
ncbi:sphingosine N-acyltransferase lag1 [Actinomortierella ambigua]|uniref:Sphingosine N-acyltransferase lag1 n=1 Tax=Actinomortierella ambigua TaxID=1343610 RepID=A0A9P6UCZ3_9FUNG|nr:sphingosine N-acyltransferase lag1 [Actinomortierella ambigua]